MSVVRNSDEQLPENLKLVVMAMKAGAGLLLVISLGGFLFPDAYMSFLGFDAFTLQTTAGAMIFVALVEIFVAIPIIIKSNKQAQKND